MTKSSAPGPELSVVASDGSVADRVTLIRPAQREGVLTKRIRLKPRGGFKITSAPNHTKFRSETREVSGIASLSALLLEIEGDPHRAVVRGRLLDTAAPEDHYRRKDTSRADGTEAFTEAPRRYVMLDIDDAPGDLVPTDPAEDPEACVRDLLALLPVCFRDATCHWQFSASQGFKSSVLKSVKPPVSAHLWFWLDAPADSGALRDYFRLYNEGFQAEHPEVSKLVDPQLFDPIQLHFTAGPDLGDGVEDPLPRRSGLLEGGRDEVALSGEWRFSREDGRFVRYLEQIGDDKNKNGFHEPIMQAIASWVSENGKPDPQSRREMVEIIRKQVEHARKSEARSEIDIERYKSDRFLNGLIDGALEKGFGNRAPNRAGIEAIRDRYVYVATSDRFVCTRSGTSLKRSGFDGQYAHLAPGRALSKSLLIDPEMRKVEIPASVPGDENKVIERENGQTVFNTWKSRPHEPVEGDVSWFTEHLKYLTDHDPEGYRHLSCYLAHVIAHPGRKVRHAIVLGSQNTGTGKSLLVTLLNNVMDPANVGVITDRELKESYNGWAAEHELLIIEELMAQGRLEIANRLKPLITEDRITVRKMYTDAYTTENPANYIAFTNHPDALVLHRNDRRYWVWFSEAEPLPDSYYAKMFKNARERAAEIYHWALNHDLKGFDPDTRPPMTESKRAMEEHAKPELVSLFETAVEECSWPLQCDLVAVSDLEAALRRERGRYYSNKKITDALKAIGARPRGQKRMKDGKRPHLWTVRNHAKWGNATETDFAEGYRRPGRRDETEGVDY